MEMIMEMVMEMVMEMIMEMVMEMIMEMVMEMEWEMELEEVMFTEMEIITMEITITGYQQMADTKLTQTTQTTRLVTMKTPVITTTPLITGIPVIKVPNTKCDYASMLLIILRMRSYVDNNIVAWPYVLVETLLRMLTCKLNLYICNSI